MGSEGDWIWTFTPRATDQFEGLEKGVQERIVAKLDDVVGSDWRDPRDFLEPVTGSPFAKLRVGEYRLACTIDRNTPALLVHRIEHRSGAYTADD